LGPGKGAALYAQACGDAGRSIAAPAALTPAEHSVTVIDENVEPIDFDRCGRRTSSA